MKHSESQEQIAVIDWIRLQHPWLINHTIFIMNEQKRTPQMGARLNRLGRLRGCSDLFIAWPTTNHYGLFIEMKSKIGKPTSYQLEFLERMNKTGYFGCVCPGAENAISVITAYLANKI